MFNSSTTSSIRILPNNKVYRQLFDAQVQLSDAYNQTRKNQLSQSLNITTRTNGVPLVRNIRPHEAQKRQWLASMPYKNDPSINPIAILFHDERKRRENEQEQELDELKREVFNLPDDVEYAESKQPKMGNVTERIATNRQMKFTQLWSELLSHISEINQNLLLELEKITRQCNAYYENGDEEINELLRALIYGKEITSLTKDSFKDASEQLDQLLPKRLSQIQEFCQLIEELESQRIHQIRDLFKHYSEQLYRTHHLSDRDTAHRLEKQANELNTQILENRRTYAELEARLLAGETVRMHHSQAELVNYQDKWKDATWVLHKQTWISKLSEYQSKFDSTILSTCESVGSNINSQTQAFIEHINTLNSFIPPTSTRENAQNWYNHGSNIVNNIVEKQQELVQRIKSIIQDELDQLEKQLETTRVKLLRERIYNEELLQIVSERDIQPLFEERKVFLQESVINRIEVVYQRLIHAMREILDRLFAFIQPAAEQWDEHQQRLENVMVQLLDMMRECRRPHDIQNEKKLTKLDSTLDDLRCASNEKALTRLLTSSYDQLDNLKTIYTQFYDMEHNIVNKYAGMIAEEVSRFKQGMLDYFHARQIDITMTDSSSSSSHQYYTTSLTQTTYELDGYLMNESTFDNQLNLGNNDQESRRSTTRKSSSDHRSQLKSLTYEQDQLQMQTFLTEDPSSNNEINTVPFYTAFQLPLNFVETIMFNLCRAYLNYYDQWKEETNQRAQAVMFAKHEELNKEMDVQMHLHEPRRLRIETDIHNVRTAEIVMHEERVERHIRGVQETLEQTDAAYGRMLIEFAKLITAYRDDINSLEQIFVHATTSGRLQALENRLKKQRNTYMERIRTSLRNFRKHFDETILYLRQTNVKFRKSFKTFSEGGNFSREEMETHRKKLEKTAYQIDQAESAIFKEMEKIEKKQLDEANKIMHEFRERFKHHMTDIRFIELANRWISDAQVKIKSEVAVSNEQARTLRALLLIYEAKIDAILHPNLDKQTTTVGEVRELFHQIVQMTYERALYLKCLNNELMIPSSLIPILKEKGLITEPELVNDLQTNGHDDGHSSRRPSKMSVGLGSNIDDAKSVRFASSSSPTTVSSQRKRGSTVLIGLTGGPAEDLTTISTIQSLLHKNEQGGPNEVVGPGLPAMIESKTRTNLSESSTESLKAKKEKRQQTKRGSTTRDSVSEKATPGNHRERPGHTRTRTEIYGFYCTFGEKPHPGQDFLSRILNHLRDTTEGVLSHSEVYYKEKGGRLVTRPQALSEKFEEFAQMMLAKLKGFEQQCHEFHEASITEFRTILESFERISSLMAKIEFDEQMAEGEKTLVELKQQFHQALEKKLDESNEEKDMNFEALRPNFGHPSKKDRLQTIDDREKQRQEDLQNIIAEFRSNTLEELKINTRATIDLFARSAERLLILFDEILTADEITRTKLPIVKQSLTELIRRQQAGRPLEDSEPIPLIERRQGHWLGLPLLDDPLDRRRESIVSKRRSSSAGLRQRTSASIVTQKTTLPQIETIKQRDEAYEKLKVIFNQLLIDVDSRCSSAAVELERYRTYWNASIDKLQQLRAN